MRPIRRSAEHQTPVDTRARAMGLFVETWAPGDGVTRYRFFQSAADADYKDPIYIALGRREAHIWLDGVLAVLTGRVGLRQPAKLTDVRCPAEIERGERITRNCRCLKVAGHISRHQFEE